jgi:hypothetical protein
LAFDNLVLLSTHHLVRSCRAFFHVSPGALSQSQAVRAFEQPVENVHPRDVEEFVQKNFPRVANRQDAHIPLCATTMQRFTLIKLCAATIIRAGPSEPNERAMIDADHSVRVEPIANPALVM